MIIKEDLINLTKERLIEIILHLQEENQELTYELLEERNN